MPRVWLQYIEGTTFAYFTASECGQQSAAITLNPSQTDFVPPFTLRNVSWDATVDYNARLYLGKTATTAPECAQTCDSYDFAAVFDPDGSLTGVVNSTVLGSNPTLAFASPKCTNVFEWAGYACPGVRMRSMTLVGESHDSTARVMGTIRFIRYEDKNDRKKTRTYFAHGPYKDMCPDIMPSLTYQFLMAPGYEYEMATTVTMPDRARVQFWSNDPSEAIMVNLFQEKPLVVNVFVDGVLVPASTVDQPTIKDPAGTNQLNPQGTPTRFHHTA